MITKESIEKKLNELYPSRNGNIFSGGRAEAVAIVETIMSQGFIDCLKFINDETSKSNKSNKSNISISKGTDLKKTIKKKTTNKKKDKK